MLAEEIADLRRTCELVKRGILKHHKRMWMLVVASKCDLYESSLETVEGYYSPSADNGFARELRGLTGDVGKLHFEWDSMPACGVLERIEWNGTTVPSTLTASQRDQLITDLLRRIERYCES